MLLSRLMIPGLARQLFIVLFVIPWPYERVDTRVTEPDMFQGAES